MARVREREMARVFAGMLGGRACNCESARNGWLLFGSEACIFKYFHIMHLVSDLAVKTETERSSEWLEMNKKIEILPAGLQALKGLECLGQPSPALGPLLFAGECWLWERSRQPWLLQCAHASCLHSSVLTPCALTCTAFTGRIIESNAASVYSLDSGTTVQGLMVSNEAATQEADD